MTERQRDRQTDRQTDRETERQRDRETDRQRDRETDRQTDRQTDNRFCFTLKTREVKRPWVTLFESYNFLLFT